MATQISGTSTLLPDRISVSVRKVDERDYEAMRFAVTLDVLVPVDAPSANFPNPALLWRHPITAHDLILCTTPKRAAGFVKDICKQVIERMEAACTEHSVNVPEQFTHELSRQIAIAFASSGVFQYVEGT